MPPLVSSKSMKSMPAAVGSRATRKLDAPAPNANLNQMTGIESMVQDLSLGKLSVEWRGTLKPPANEFFECRVTHIEAEGPIWVMHAANKDNLKRLTDRIAHEMQSKQPCNFEMLSVDDLVGVVVDNKMFRGEVRALISASGAMGAEVRLIDFGSIFRCDACDIYGAVQSMAEIKRFAFRVKLPTNTDVQLNKYLSLRLMGSQTDDGIEHVQLKPKMKIPINLPLQMLAVNPEVSVVRILQHDDSREEPQVALLQIKVMSNLNDDLNACLIDKPVQPFTGRLPQETRTFFLAARTHRGFRRAMLLDFIEHPSLYLVYEMDEGRISITNEVCRIPSELLEHSLRVFAVTLADAGNLRQQLTQCASSGLCIKFQMESLQGVEKEMSAAQATLLLANNNEPVCAVRVNSFLGHVDELSLKFWRERIENGSLVYIAHVASIVEVCISSVITKQYQQIFQRLDYKCLPFKDAGDISIGSIVLVVTAVKNNTFSVVNIDTGCAQDVPEKWLRMPCSFVENLPVSLCRARISTICNLPLCAVPENSAGLQLLMKLCQRQSEMKVEFKDSECSIIDLLDFSVEPQSLMTRMLPLMFTPAPVEQQSTQNVDASARVLKPEAIQASPMVESAPHDELPPLPLSPPNTPIQKGALIAGGHIERYYFSDMERHPIPLGEKMQIIVLNAIDVHKTGCITACFFSSEEVAEHFQDLLNKVFTIGKTHDKLTSPRYIPDVDEMCLCLYAEDNTWYRGVCQRVTAQEACILYCDFGNSEMVPLDRIKPIPKNLLQRVYATKCFIDGFDKDKNFLSLEKSLAVKNKILCNVLDGPELNTRRIYIPHLDKILSRQII
ncbi:GH17400 [Drosophila grimshawi]|uniref:GH17400 n=1 Tax=Drosophila grimshawi TaxID=7222 RepID=B4JV45_DROGR|nr:GH17400 [Drosophila grimshawi]